MRRRWLLAPLTALAVTVPATAANAAPGGLDPSFGHGGTAITNGFGTPSGAALEPNGDILVAVDSQTGGPDGVLRYLPSGALDSSFGTGGFAAVTSVTLQLSVSGVAVQSDGKILVASGATSSTTGQTGISVARLNANGSLDASFGSGGIAFAAAAGGPGAPAVLQEPNGDVLAGGSFLTVVRRGSDTTTGVVARFTPGGQADGTFGSGGVVSSTALGALTNLGVDSAGDVFVLPAAVELSPAGAVDPSVTAEPIVASSPGGPDAFLANGESVRATSAFINRVSDEVETQRFLANGALDSSFPTAEFHYVAGQTARDFGDAIALEPNGDIVAGGSHWLGTNIFAVARLTSAGVLDSTFGSGGTVTTTIQGDESVGTLLAQPNDDIVAIGFTENNSTGVSGVALARYLG